MNKTLVISIIFLALLLYHGAVYTAAWFQCCNYANEVGEEAKHE